MLSMTKLPSDALTKRTNPVRTALIAGASIVAIAGLSFGGVALTSAISHPAAPTATAEALPTDGPSPLSPAELAQIQQSAVDQQAQLAAQAAADKAAADAAAAQAAADAAAAQKAAAPKTIAAGAPGSKVPFIKSTDPQNANGGSYEDPGVYCQSHSASGNPPVCD